MAKRVGRLGVECKGFEDKFLNETKLFAELFSARVSRGIGKKKKNVRNEFKEKRSKSKKF